MKVLIIIWQNSCVTKITIYVRPRLSSRCNYFCLPTTPKSNWENKWHILHDAIAFICYVCYVCNRHREEAHVRTPSGQWRGRLQGGLPTWMKREWRLQCVVMDSFWKPLICTGLYLQKELMPAKALFFAMDVACKYWPYLEKAVSVLPALHELTTMKPVLSVMQLKLMLLSVRYV